ncbi:MAG: flavin reductase family protein [Burkholderiales bacterium]|jgi:flavin reductase (DIM6/NTAB) family NADH-FMN oxidoreductase RutF
MKTYRKRDFPVADVRRYLEPGPIVLVSSHYKGRANIMTMGWHSVMEFAPSLVGCCVSRANHSHTMIRGSGECVINVPTRDLARIAVAIGNCSGADVDKFARFGLTPEPATKVGAPLIAECRASFECRVHDRRLVRDYDFFVLEVVKSHVATRPKWPTTIHYRGEGVFMVAGRHIDLRKGFRRDRL